MRREQKLLVVLARRIQAARLHEIAFANFVLREEFTRKSLRITPHQRVLLKFVRDHRKCVLMLPVGHGKTFLMGAVALYELGRDPTCRGAVVSATQGQAQKVLSMVRAYIEGSAELHAVFPALWPSSRRVDPWTTSCITVRRPDGIRDPSLQAVGLEGAINGSRLKLIIVDDVLTHENTLTRDGRDKVCEFMDSTVLSRLDVTGSKIVITNTAWHDDDLAHRYLRSGWPTLRMEITGAVEISNADNWDCNELRPAGPDTNLCKLTALSDESALWPERFTPEVIETLKQSHLPHRFNQLYRNLCYNEETARCKLEWIEKCKQKARVLGVSELVTGYRGPNLTVTGVDLAVSPGEANDFTAFFTFECLPDGHKRILDIDIGHWDGPTVVRKLQDKYRAYNSIVRVECNASLDFVRQFALQIDAGAPIKSHITGRGKAHPEHGVEGLFVEMHNGAWLIPNDLNGNVCTPVKEFIAACINYNPSKHVDDVLMAAYFAREQAREFGALGPVTTAGKTSRIGAAIMAR